MKKYSPLLVIWMIAFQTNSFCQTPQPCKETKLTEFANVVAADSLEMEWLFRNAKKYIGSLKGYDEKFELKLKDSIDGKLYGQGSFFVYSQTGILKKISGLITYQIAIEMKDNKYRYQFSDFTFHYYKQDRYFNTVDTGKTKSLGDSKAPGWQKLWTAHQSTCRTRMNANSERLMKTMMEKPVIVDTRKEKKIEW